MQYKYKSRYIISNICSTHGFVLFVKYEILHIINVCAITVQI